MSPSTKCSAVDLLADAASRASVLSVPWPMRMVMSPVSGSMRSTVPVRISCSLEEKLVEDHAALGLADALNDDLLGRLGGDAAEGLRLDLHVHEIAELCVRVDLARGVERDLGGGGDDLVDDLLLRIHAHGVLRQLDVDVVGVAVAGPFYKRRQAPA